MLGKSAMQRVFAEFWWVFENFTCSDDDVVESI